MKDIVARIDRFQRDHPVAGFPLAVAYKFSDDQGGYLAATITYYAFVAIFPLLLIASSILGFVLQGDPALQKEILDSALSQFPIVGGQLGRPEGLRGSATAVIVGTVAALYGVLGLGQASQNVLNTAWSVPRNSRPNPILGRLRSLALLALGGIAVLAVTVLTSLGSHLEVFSDQINTGLVWALKAGAIALNAAVLAVLFRAGTAHKHRLSAAVPGALTVAVMWQLLQALGGVYVARVIARAGAMNGVFALVLGLLGLIYVACVVAVIGAEVNAVRAKRLYPRALLTPFTDNVELTDADRRAYADYAKAQRHKGFQRVRVSFAEGDATRQGGAHAAALDGAGATSPGTRADSAPSVSRDDPRSDPVRDPLADPVGEPRADPVGEPRADPVGEPRADPVESRGS